MIEVHTPTRLHFGLLAYSRDESRQFGGAGLMVQQPRIAVRVTPADRFTATGPLAERALSFAHTFAGNWAAMHHTFEAVRAARHRGSSAREKSLHVDSHEPFAVQGASIEVLEAPRAHTGMGTGTQLAMAVGRALAELYTAGDAEHLGVHELATLVGRGARSAIGAHGFFHGGLIIEGGKLLPESLSPMLVQQHFPPDWRLVLVTPQRLIGIAGDREKQAFKKMSPIPREVTAEMCRLVMLGLLPAVVDRDLQGFSASLYELQQRVGACFAAAQGGIYADPLLERIVRFTREQGVEGIGQSSWGPTLYAVTGDEASAQALVDQLRTRFDLDDRELMVTSADNQGCEVRSE